MGAFEALDQQEMLEVEGGDSALGTAWTIYSVVKEVVTTVGPYYVKAANAISSYGDSHGWNNCGSKRKSGRNHIR